MSPCFSVSIRLSADICSLKPAVKVEQGLAAQTNTVLVFPTDENQSTKS